MMLAGFLTPSAFAISPAEGIDTVASGQIVEPVEGVNSAETNVVEESRLTQEMEKLETPRKGMSQEEKKANAEANDEYGLGITIIAMCIVLGALIVLSILFMIFGKISASLLTKKKLKSKGMSKDEADDHHTAPDSGEVIAAISMALAEHLDYKGHDMERTILTLRRMKRAYSPWNSKIYNIRHVPEQPISKNRLH